MTFSFYTVIYTVSIIKTLTLSSYNHSSPTTQFPAYIAI